MFRIAFRRYRAHQSQLSEKVLHSMRRSGSTWQKLPVCQKDLVSKHLTVVDVERAEKCHDISGCVGALTNLAATMVCFGDCFG